MDQRAASGRVLRQLLSAFVMASTLLVTACGGGGGHHRSSGGSDDGGDGGGGGGGGGTVEAMSGAGVDGPLANAIVTLYAIDTAQADYKGTVLGTGTTNEQAQIQDIDKPDADDAPYLLEFTADSDSRDLTACEDGSDEGTTINVATECLAPVVGTLRTIVTADMLDSNRPVYATLLTTMATDLAIASNGIGGSTSDLLTALQTAAAQVKSTVGFGLDSSTDIFTTPPILDETTTTADEQEEVVAYRAAVQALASVIDQMADAIGGADPVDVLTALTEDLGDGEIDGEVDGDVQDLYSGSGTQAAATLQLLQQDPASLPVPNDPQGRTVGDMAAILLAEIETTGNDDVDTEIEDDYQPEMKPAETDPDLDDDGTPNESDAFPTDNAETTDSDGDGIGNNADTDDDNDGVSDANDAFDLNANEHTDTDSDGTGNNADSDDDGDGVADSSDDFPLDGSKSNATDVDNDGWPTEQDANDNDNSVPGTAFTDTDGDGVGNTTDLDDDNDGVADSSDDFPLDASEANDTDSDGTGDNTDTDIDGDGVANASDLFPRDASETTDTDKDGIGNTTDTDDDNDGVSDEDEDAAGTDPLDLDSDNDGALDGVDAFPLNALASFDADGDGIPARPANLPAEQGTDLTFDNCPTVANTSQQNSDDDELGDACDSDDDNDDVSDANDAFDQNAGETTDSDSDGIGNNADSDDDNDGVADSFDAFPLDATETTDTDSDGTGNNDDDDDDGDGVGDTEDDFPLDGTRSDSTDADADGWPAGQDADDNDNSVPGTAFTDTDGDGVGDTTDSDDDNDGVPDANDALPLDETESVDTDSDGTGNNADTDDDGDGVADSSDKFPLDETESVDTDNDGTGNNADTDDDNDGVLDANDAAATDPDADDDGAYDGIDNCPAVSNASQLNSDQDTNGGDACDSDDDNDTVVDGSDNCPLIANTSQLDTDSDSQGNVCDSDDDGDDVLDSADKFPLDGDESADDDNDNVGNNGDNCPANSNADQLDTDSDDQGNACDSDDDGDTVADASDNCPLNSNADQLNTDGDSQGNVCDSDDDGDGVADGSDAFPLNPDESADTDGDSVGDNGDNCPANSNSDQADLDSDDQGNVCDSDDDGDSVADGSDNCPANSNADQLDTDSDDQGNVCDSDDDGDSVADASDNCPVNSNADQLDTDSDDQGNVCDTDDDGDTVADGSDNCPLVSNSSQADANGNGVGDACEAAPADIAGFWVASITVASASTSGTLSTLADECSEAVSDKKAAVAWIAQDTNAIQLRFGSDGDEGDEGTIDGLGSVQFGHSRDDNRYNSSSGSVEYSLEETLAFSGSVDSTSAPTVITATSITETRTFYEDADQSGAVVGTCTTTYTGTLTRMASVAASDLLNPASVHQGLAFTDSDSYSHDETGAEIRHFGYTRIDTSAAADYDWSGSTWQVGDHTSWWITDNGWEELPETPAVEGTPTSTAILSRGSVGHYGSHWQVTAVAGAINNLPLLGFAEDEDDWSEALPNPTANFADPNARAVGVTVTALMDEYEIRCDYNLPKQGLLNCENWLYQSYPGTDDAVTTANLADALTDLLHASGDIPVSPIGGVGMGRRYDSGTEYHVFAWLTGSTLTGAAGTSGNVVFYSYNQSTSAVTLLSGLSATWSISDVTGGGELVLQFTIPDALSVDEFWYDFDENRHVVIANAALSDSTAYLRVGYFTATGTEQQHWGINGAALEELITGFDYSLPDTDSDGVDDESDNCPADANADQADTDSNGRGDVCDGTSEPDADSDGVPDSSDNCPSVANADQADSDSDGQGDACDSGGSGTITDTDADGVLDDDDAFPSDEDEQYDTDGDGTGDNSDTCPYTSDTTCAHPGVDMAGLYLVQISSISGQEWNEATSTCETITDPTAYFIARISQTGNQIQLVNVGDPSSDFDAGTVEANGDFVLNGIVTTSEFTGNFDDSTNILTGSYTETTGSSCVQTGNVSAIPGTAVTESSVGSTGVAWFEGEEEESVFEFDYGVVSESAEQNFIYDYDTSGWVSDNSPEQEYYLTSTSVLALEDRYIISGYVSAGETAIINPTLSGVAQTSVIEHLDLRAVDLNGIPMAMIVRGYDAALEAAGDFTTGATGYLATIESQTDSYRFWCDDDWNAYVASHYTCANIVAQSWADLDSDGSSDDPVAATDIDQIVSTPTEMANINTVSGRGLWAGDGYDAAEFHINGYLVSDDGTLAGANLKMVFVKSYWYENEHFTLGEASVDTGTVGSIDVVEWTVPERVRRLGNLDEEEANPFLFVESELDSTPLVRRGERDLAGRINYELLFNSTARDQVLGGFTAP